MHSWLRPRCCWRTRSDFPSPRFPAFLPAAAVVLAATILLQLLIGATVGLYSSEGRGTWPVRLASAAIVGAVAGLAGGGRNGDGTGSLAGSDHQPGAAVRVRRRAMALVSSGLLVRRQRRKELRDRFGDADLVEIGSDLGSMTGGVLRTWGYRHLLVNIVVEGSEAQIPAIVTRVRLVAPEPARHDRCLHGRVHLHVCRVPPQRFVLFILVGLLAWNFFAGSVTSASEAVTSNAPLQKSVVFPRTDTAVLDRALQPRAVPADDCWCCFR